MLWRDWGDDGWIKYKLTSIWMNGKTYRRQGNNLGVGREGASATTPSTELPENRESEGGT